MDKMKKRTPKNSGNKRKKSKERQENAIILGIFIVFIVIVAYLFYTLQINSPNEDTIAVVNGEEITKQELDSWYKISINPEHRNIVTKHDFLALSLIPQEVLLQKAKEENIKISNDEVEKLIGSFVIENGFTLDQFEEHLNERGITIDDIKKSFESRGIIIKLFEKEKLIGENENLLFDANDETFQEYINGLMDSSNIEIFPENIDKSILKAFEATQDEICNEEKPVVRLYTTSWCEVCYDSAQVFNDLVKEFVENDEINAIHWSLDTGDNFMTIKKEKGIPENEAALFKKYSPNNLVPTVVLGCKYKRVGSLTINEADEFKALIKTLTGS